MGQKFAAFNSQGVIFAFYDSEDSPVPSGVSAIKISDAEWQTCIGQPGWTVSNGTLVAPSAAQQLAVSQSQQDAALENACSAAITAGFTSSALGSANTYPSDVATQGNIDRAAVHGGTIWCANSGGNWSLAQHTAAQALQVQVDLWAHIQSCQSKLATLKAQVAAATTVSAVEAFVWS